MVVPVFSFILYRTVPSLREYGAFFFALIGLWIFTAPHDSLISSNDLLLLLSASSYTVYTIGLSHFKTPERLFAQTFVAYCVVAILSAIATLALEPVHSTELSIGNLSLLGYLIIFGTIIRFLGQTWAQRTASPTRTALIFTLEPVITLAISAAIYGERFTSLKLGGGLVILVASLLATLPSRNRVQLAEHL